MGHPYPPSKQTCYSWLDLHIQCGDTVHKVCTLGHLTHPSILTIVRMHQAKQRQKKKAMTPFTPCLHFFLWWCILFIEYACAVDAIEGNNRASCVLLVFNSFLSVRCHAWATSPQSSFVSSADARWKNSLQMSEPANNWRKRSQENGIFVSIVSFCLVFWPRRDVRNLFSFWFLRRTSVATLATFPFFTFSSYCTFRRNGHSLRQLEPSPSAIIMLCFFLCYVTSPPSLPSKQSLDMQARVRVPVPVYWWTQKKRRSWEKYKRTGIKRNVNFTQTPPPRSFLTNHSYGPRGTQVSVSQGSDF